MKTFIALSLCLISLPVLAEPIITDINLVESYNESLRKNPYYLKVGPVKRKIFDFEIGKAETPYYEHLSEVKRFYRKDQKCFELTVYSTMNLARKVSCYDKKQELFLEGFEDYKVVAANDLIVEGLEGFKTGEIQQSFELEAYLQLHDMFAFDREIYGESIDQSAPRRKFTVEVNGFNEVMLKKDGLQLQQNLELSVSKIGVLPAKSSKTTNSVKVVQGGMIFSNGQGKILVYNPVLPKGFGTYELTLNSNIVNYIETLAKNSLEAPVCFRDNYMNPGAKDCHKLIFETFTLGSIQKMKILSLDFVNKRIEFFNLD